MQFSLQSPVTELPKIGFKTASLLEKLGIKTLADLLFYFPSRYENLQDKKLISNLQPEQKASIEAQVWQVKTIRTYAGKFLTTALLNDGSGSVEAVWFNQPYLEKMLKNLSRVHLAGKVSLYRGKLTFVSPTWELEREVVLHTAPLVPVYPQTAGLNSRWLREKIKFLLDSFSEQLLDSLPEAILKKEGLPTLLEALKDIHFPKALEAAKRAKRRFAFEELFLLQLASLKRKRVNQEKQKRPAFEIPEKEIEKLIKSLPFKLTNSQLKATKEILADLRKTQAMNRLLQGEVGSGKTIVAALAAFVAGSNGQRTIFMAPTEILAKQHFRSLETVFSKTPFSIGLATGAEKTKVAATVLVGTQALLNLDFKKSEIGLVVIDEQHRFGVEQRSKLRQKALIPNVLTLSATPIPRTLALIFFGELEVSVLEDLPAGRKVAKTRLVGPEKRDAAYDFIRKHIKAGEQAFIVCPLIEESETLQSLRSVKKEFAFLSEEIFPEFEIGLLHGKLSSKEKGQVLDRFRSNQDQILVATPVVEVGIDIPNATIILIEGADRFGLASLHQLRGRVGRRERQSFCLLFSDGENLARLKKMETLTSGFALAETDLSFRGPGQVFGQLQAGLPDLKVASLTDTILIKKARAWAEKLLQGGGRELSASLQNSLDKKIKDLGFD
ncbi:MAG: ATP-dependent DNA helicase RecG [bacterium]|nr:ATP-dependent DNA helicase RecG [bacterium]